MASKQTYPCFACRKAGYEIPVYLDGKDEQGRTKYLNEDGTKHIHKAKADTRPNQNHLDQETSFDNRALNSLLVSMDSKLDRLLNLAERK